MTEQPQNIDHKKEMAKSIRTAVRKAELSYKTKHEEARPLKISLELSAYKPRPREMRQYAPKIVGWFIQSATYRQMSNAAIAAKLGEQIGGYRPPSNLLTQTLHRSQTQKIAQLLSERGISIDLSRLTTLSKIKKALSIYFEEGLATQKFEETITITNQHVIVGSRSFPINREGKYERIDVAGAKINLASLKLLLSAK